MGLFAKVQSYILGWLEDMEHRGDRIDIAKPTKMRTFLNSELSSLRKQKREQQTPSWN